MNSELLERKRMFNLTLSLIIMCGICGVWEYGRSDGRVERALAAMRDEMPHRGPDDTGALIFDKGAAGSAFVGSR